MLMKSIAAGLAGTALLATVAFAQNPTTTTDKSAPAASATTTSASGEWRASKMAGVKVYNEANENIGSINDLLMDKSGAVKIAVIGVGGFLGMGEHLVAVPYEKLKFVNEAVAYTGTGANPANPNAKPAATTTTGAATGTDKTATTTSSSSSKWYPDHAVFNATKDQLKSMPEFKYSE
ncbi:PRC-barrel domain-containing protein [Bradyrhizobium guangdongense]|uniref:PRC-barrel domain containing protein n=1 Tax=Bradyrhizobium guangdongense TaxID=1325090 RepID=A0A410V2Q8_9BRAD|nr:PRC-barrel domain-containing protein [Bradyrhizobium guangdongense]QAU37974.1 PRC-barrel domain containing protein [Bradyrhizobium guangdongense]QOZ59032.1 PRC-barrel domain containing protein [Bradyrhizobium guangdongense]GGI19153.1 photosystem reaction center subunit H [Bradyrhizobium guangdongense]